MANSVNEKVTDAVLAKVVALNLALPGGDPVPVVARKLPAASESIDTPPLVAVVPSEIPGVDEPFDSGDALCPQGRRWREYVIQVVVIAVADGDNVTNLDEYRRWRQAISRAFGGAGPLPTVDEFVRLEVMPGAVIDREAHSKNYDYSAVGLNVCCVEPAE